jgi:hypothetical protein
MSLTIFAIIAYLVNFGLESQRKVAEEAKRTVFVADSIRKAGEERSAFVADSIKKISEAQTKSILDSIKAKEAEKQKIVSTPHSAPTSTSIPNSSTKTELYWVGNGDETSKIIFEKLSGAGLKTGKCSGNGIKVSTLSKPSCKPNAMGTVKCSYTPQLTAASCGGSQIEKLTFSREFIGSNKDEAVEKQKLLKELENVNLSEWIGKLKSLRI